MHIVDNNVQDIVIDKLFRDIGSLYMGDKYLELAIILCSIKGLSVLHQSHHWKSKGQLSYTDHLLYERIYSGTSEDIDGFAERIVGLATENLVNPEKLLEGSYKFIKLAKETSSSDDYAKISLAAEELFIDILEGCMSNLENHNLLSRGLEQMLGDIANKHETFIYLLKQRVK